MYTHFIFKNIKNVYTCTRFLSFKNVKSCVNLYTGARIYWLYMFKLNALPSPLKQ